MDLGNRPWRVDRGEVRLQRRHGDPAILARIDAVTRMPTAHRSTGLGQPPGAWQGQISGRVGQRNVQAHTLALLQLQQAGFQNGLRRHE